MASKSKSRSLSTRPHRLSRPLSDSRRRGTEPVGELILQRVPDDDDPFLRQVEGNAALGMSGKVDHAHFGPKGNDVAVIETVVNGDGAPHEPSEDGPSHRCEQSILQWTRGHRRARDDVRFQPVNGDPRFAFPQPARPGRPSGLGGRGVTTTRLIWSRERSSASSPRVIAPKLPRSPASTSKTSPPSTRTVTLAPIVRTWKTPSVIGMGWLNLTILAGALSFVRDSGGCWGHGRQGLPKAQRAVLVQ